MLNHFRKNFKWHILLLLGAAILVIVGISTGIPNKIGTKTEAQSNSDASGWAWSDTIGWISFNSANHGGSNPYRVSVDTNN
ncbi:MAG: hypothetical protein WC894_06320, partial [Patescibacteria group bacterium]